jgi:hypothetical protein
MKNITAILIPAIMLLGNLKTNPGKGAIYCNNARTKTDTTEKTIKTKNYEATTSNISFARIETYFDSGYYPRSLYYNIRFTEVLGVSMQEAAAGKLVVTLSGENNKPIALPKEARLYVARTFKETAQINILISIPLNPADASNKSYHYGLSLKKSTGSQFIYMRGKLSN